MKLFSALVLYTLLHRGGSMGDSFNGYPVFRSGVHACFDTLAKL